MPLKNYICCFGEVLWDLLPDRKLPGGAPMNVATHLQNIDCEAFMISKTGDDVLGEELRSFLNQKNCSTDFIQKDEIHATGIVKVTLSEKMEASYEIVQPIAWDFIEANPINIALVQSAKAIVFSTLGLRNIVSKTTLLTLIQGDALVICDVNFRPPFDGQAIIEESLELATIVKMNQDELEKISQWNKIEVFSDEVKMRFLLEKHQLSVLIMTRGENGAAVLTSEGFFEHAGYQVSVADTIGSGDAFLAGFLKNYFDCKPTAHALQYACALGALVASRQGANPPLSEIEIFRMIETN